MYLLPSVTGLITNVLTGGGEEGNDCIVRLISCDPLLDSSENRFTLII